ncbi:hypothetical protein DPMN_171437 [Dreissena polymorpha]|uniref:Uncharacterized protein n=1 Tax=Dreissena polymorpha TaxID=45954 RepID=A0A9D4DY10_DREPO|nr:hypothetical protein DPMN_171437 [Dreissena polymorpha]
MFSYRVTATGSPGHCAVCHCGAQRCAFCPYMMTADYFTDPSGRKYSVRNNVDCKSSNVVYAVNCRRCRKYVYVGETGGTLYQRHLLNLSRIRTQHSDPVAEHFYTDGHSMDDFQKMGLYIYTYIIVCRS